MSKGARMSSALDDMLEWKQVGDRWIAHVIEGDAEQGRYEVSESSTGWKCAWFFHHNELAGTVEMATFEHAKRVAEQHWETGGWPGHGEEPRTAYVLYIQFADDPPRVAVFDSFDEAENCLDAFEVTVFDPPFNDDLLALRHTFRARIFECKGVSFPFNYKRGDCSGWGTEVRRVNGR